MVAVLTGADLANDKIGNLICGWMIHSKDGSPMKMAPHPALAAGTVNHVGDAVAVVIAERQAQARDAAEKVKVDYEVLPAGVDPAKAQAQGAPQIHADIANNTIYQWHLGDPKAVDAAFAKAAGKPFDLPRPLRPPLKPIGLALEVHPWEYLHELNTGGIVKVVTITSPVRYVVSYTSGLSLSRLRLGIAGKEEKKPEDVREFVIRSCILHLMLTRFPGITNLLRALRWEVDASTSPELGDLPLVTLTAPLKTVLPPDNLILDSTEMSGTSVFEEVVDVDEISRIEDPLVQKVQSIMAAAQGGTSRERT